MERIGVGEIREKGAMPLARDAERGWVSPDEVELTCGAVGPGLDGRQGGVVL